MLNGQARSGSGHVWVGVLVSLILLAGGLIGAPARARHADELVAFVGPDGFAERWARVRGMTERAACVDQGVSAAVDARGTSKLWVFFTDKRLSEEEEVSAILDFESRLSPRAMSRRAKVGKAVDINDLPVAAEYVGAVTRTGAELVTRSRWLNAVSVFADSGQAARVAALPFVREVRPVMMATKKMPEFTTVPGRAVGEGRGRSLDYGPSFGQLDQMQVPKLHDEGFDGTAAIVAMLDTGFDRDHQALRDISVIAEHDFINDDDNTADEPGDPEGQDAHGTATLSCVGASFPGEIYGGAFGAEFILCKTEIVDDEIQIEEDYWVEGIEWADSLGADIASSSLGYFYWYTYEDMDGDTAVTTIAADLAAERGIVVVNSMGNEGDSSWRYMIAPADGDTVLSIGAVDIEGERTAWSSVGPTYDGRTKPDVMALGSDVYVATTDDTASYGYTGGTSFSCPLTSSAVALLLEGHPEWTPLCVGDALRSTATQSGSPDTLMGWGIVQAHDAMHSQPLVVETGNEIARRLVWSRPNPYSRETAVQYVVPAPGHVRLEIYDLAGRIIRVLYDGEREAGTFTARWDGADSHGARASSGVYFCRMTVLDLTSATKITLLR